MKDLLPKIAHERGSLSVTIERGTPCNLIISLTKTSATVHAVKGCRRLRKWAYLDKRSTTTKMWSILLDRGNPEIKSILRSSQICLGICRGCKSPARLKESFVTLTDKTVCYIPAYLFHHPLPIDTCNQLFLCYESSNMAPRWCRVKGLSRGKRQGEQCVPCNTIVLPPRRNCCGCF